MPEYFVGWFTLVVINMGFAELKCRSRANWFLLSLLLGPIATFLVVVLDKGEAPKPFWKK